MSMSISGPATLTVGELECSTWIGIGWGDASFFVLSEPDWSARLLQTVWHVVAPSMVVSAVVLSVGFERYSVTTTIKSHLLGSIVPLPIELMSL